jgi:glycosyltransferase involved in cell wall biosynthesis
MAYSLAEVRAAFVIGGIPSLGHSGSTLASWTIIEALLQAGHDVTAVLCPAGYLLDETVPARLEALERLGADVRVVEVPTAPAPPSRWTARTRFARALVKPLDSDLFPSVRAADGVRAAIRDADVGMAFGIEAIAATARLRDPPFLAVLSHPPGVPRRLRLRYDAGGRSVVTRASELSFVAHADRRTARLLRGFASVGVFSGHHAAWARRHGVAAWYAHYPMPDLAGPQWRERRAAAQTSADRPRILMIGHLRGIGTISGFHLFVPEMLPLLTAELGPDGFEVHVVGGQDPPAAFAEGLRHPAVRLRGQIEKPEGEFFAAQVLLAPNPTTTGASARILSGLTFGSCIVAHTDSLVGIPELRHGVNCLLSADAAGLARETTTALRDAGLRERLGDEARRLYESAFSPPVAAGRLVQELERISRSSLTARSPA